MTENLEKPDSVNIPSLTTPDGFNVPVVQFVDVEGNSSDTPQELIRAKSPLSHSPSITEAEMLELEGSTGKLLYFRTAKIEIGDVFYLRERDTVQTENGIVVQIIKKEAATYAQADSKSLWRLLTTVRAQQLQRAHFESPDMIDLFLSATFKVRAAIVNGKWESAAGRVVTRNVDIFYINPKLLLENILTDKPKVNVLLGAFNGESVRFSGQGFDKINLITGMKGAGKSHISKGIIDQSRQRGMTAVVFDINDEYGKLPGAIVFKPGDNLKFRLDRVEPKTILDVINMLAPFSERTQYAAVAGIYRLFKDRKEKGKSIDLKFLSGQANVVLPGNASYIQNMQAAYVQSLETISTYNLFMDEAEIIAEDNAIKNKQELNGNSLTSAFYNLDQKNDAGVIVFSIGGLLPELQRSIVNLVLDGLKEICSRQNKKSIKDTSYIPIYPTVYFEEAHMYMEREFINRLIPVIRHLGMNLFFVTNTPGELPDSVFRLLDNLIMTRMVNEADIHRVSACGLTDGDTINSFAPELPEHHALILSAKDGATNNFPLVFNVMDFQLPKSGVTRSMWRALAEVPEE